MFKRIFAAAALMLALSACAGPRYVVSDVTRFHMMGGALSGQTFAIVAVGPEQEQSIAFRQFGDLINARLSALGMKQFSGSAPTGADYVVTLEYDSQGPTPDIQSRGGSFSFGFGYSNYRRPWGYGFGYDPFFDDHSYTETRQLFTRRVSLNMYRGSTYVSGPKLRLFEGRAISTGLNGQVETVMPYMLDAIFKDFPGTTGQTRTVAVELPAAVENSGERTPRPNSRARY